MSDKIIKPEVCDILLPTDDYRNPWFNDENKAKNVNDAIKSELVKKNKFKKQNELNKKIIDDFIILFVNLNNREPMDSEIYDNLKEKLDQEVIKKYIDESKSISFKLKINENINGVDSV